MTSAALESEQLRDSIFNNQDKIFVEVSTSQFAFFWDLNSISPTQGKNNINMETQS